MHNKRSKSIKYLCIELKGETKDNEIYLYIDSNKELYKEINKNLREKYRNFTNDDINYYYEEDWIIIKEEIIKYIKGEIKQFKICKNYKCKNKNECIYTNESKCKICLNNLSSFCKKCKNFYKYHDSYECAKKLNFSDKKITGLDNKYNLYNIMKNGEIICYRCKPNILITDLESKIKLKIKPIKNISIQDGSFVNQIFENGDFIECKSSKSYCSIL